jgi:hypothetical protein
MPLKIEEMFAFVTVDADGNEGVAAMKTVMGWMPMVGADWNMVQSLKPAAVQIANAIGRPIKLIKFRERIEVEDIP